MTDTKKEKEPEKHKDKDKETDKGKDKQKPVRKRNVVSRGRTGCLTCRRRRLKCDEAKPACNTVIDPVEPTFPDPRASWPAI